MKLNHAFLIAAGLLSTPMALAQDKAPASKSAPAKKAAPEDKAQGQMCPCCGKMMGGKGQMMGGGGGHMQHGDGKMMGEGHGMGDSGGGCGPMRAMADVKVEQTPQGAVLRLTAKDAAQVAQVQEHARMMERCMGGGAAGAQPAKGP